MEREKIISLLIIGLLISVAVGGTLWVSSMNVPVGYVGIIEDSGSGTITQVGDGMKPVFLFGALIHPLVSGRLVYVGTETVHMWGSSAEGDEAGQHGDHYPAIRTLSKDGLSIDVDVTVRWRLNPGKVLDLYVAYPAMNWQDALIIPTVREVGRNVLTAFTGMEIISDRSSVDTAVAIAMEEAFKDLPSVGDAIIYDEMNMRDIGLPDAFTSAIEEKAAAEQLAVAAVYTAQQITTLAQANADALIIAALAMANATIVGANASAQAVLIQAESIAEAVSMLANASGTTNATQIAMMYLWIQALQIIANSSGNATFFITFGEGGIPYVYTINPDP
jgi:regulator of protease activity HflC (stomatin/prohibitin superfamily)